ncbi:adenine nucleotide alpha hydrolases-like protein [Hesseltinella vesiculosa]|uniref:Adenine nucleotide alpha hydrolases-like protein n=1 Tax=Hesseltinella vesiculosa TaxID=101127 RepID=A0A1X2GCD3_9FUNG|nr:adenine nucleotide alpha hydrolases-like protein [Hesseltinella vesiculosa]
MSTSIADCSPTESSTLGSDLEVHSSTPHPEHSDQVKRVVCICLDESSGKVAFEWALDQFIQPATDMITLLHVRQLDIPIAPYMNAAGYLDEMSEERRDESHRLLKHYASILVRKKVACKAISMVGDPKSELVRKIKEIKADAVIVGSRNYGVLKRALLGSVSDHLAHHCPCTVIIAKPCEEHEHA